MPWCPSPVVQKGLKYSFPWSNIFCFHDIRYTNYIEIYLEILQDIFFVININFLTTLYCQVVCFWLSKLYEFWTQWFFMYNKWSRMYSKFDSKYVLPWHIQSMFLSLYRFPMFSHLSYYREYFYTFEHLLQRDIGLNI